MNDLPAIYILGIYSDGRLLRRPCIQRKIPRSIRTVQRNGNLRLRIFITKQVLISRHKVIITNHGCFQYIVHLQSRAWKVLAA